MAIPVFNLLRWVQQHPKVMRLVDLLLGAASIGIGIWQDSSIWIIMGVIFVLAAIFRLGERMNLFMPKLKSPKSSGRDKDA